MTIGKKITGLCVLLITFMVALGGVALWKVSAMAETSRLLSVDSLPGLYLTGRISAIQAQIRVHILTHIASSDAKHMAAVEAKIEEADKQFKKVMADYESTIQTASDREMWSKTRAAYDAMMSGWENKVRAPSRRSQNEVAFKMFSQEVEPKSVLLTSVVNDLIEFNRNQGDEYSALAAKTASSARLWVAGILFISLIVAAAAAFVFIRSTTGILQAAVTQLAEGAEQVSAAASQISSGAQAMAQGTSEQAASLEETSASAEEMSSMTQRNAENSKESATLVALVDDNVGAANRTLDEMMASMKEIGESSHKISKIIKVIDEIAFQTNILALNAAVEAARAGEAGMGFAVVADEVRNLAQRSAQAAKDTALLIEESITRSGEGSAKLDRVAASIRSITDSASKVRMLVDEVNLGSTEQATGIQQISRSIVEMQGVSQQTAAQAEESAAAGEELASQSESMKQAVGNLRSLVVAS